MGEAYIVEYCFNART